jgi:hypothetical protein
MCGRPLRCKGFEDVRARRSGALMGPACSGHCGEAGFTHKTPRAERDGNPDNHASLPPLRGASVAKP